MTRYAIAVLAASIGSMGLSAQSDDLNSRIRDALDMARPALLAHVKAASKNATRAGELSLLLLAALHDGVPSDDAIMAKAIRKLGKAKIKQTYDLALRLLVLEACPTFPDRDEDRQAGHQAAAQPPQSSEGCIPVPHRSRRRGI